MRKMFSWLLMTALCCAAEDSLDLGQIVYRAPEGIDSGLRVNGTSRGAAQDLPSLFVLAPDHVGLTLRQQPDLFWYQSRPSTVQFELTMVADGIPEPVLSLSRPAATGAGIMRLDLAEHQIDLRPDVEYQWSVALVVDPDNRSLDVVASGYVRRTAPNPKLSAKLVKQSKAKLVQVYADSGIWYDALESVCDLIDAKPKDMGPRRLRAMLLDQVGLPEPANFDREAVKVAAGE